MPFHPPSISLSEVLSDTEMKLLRHRLTECELRLVTRIPDDILFTLGGEPNLRNRYGAILFHVRQLQSIMSNFGYKED